MRQHQLGDAAVITSTTQWLKARVNKMWPTGQSWMLPAFIKLYGNTVMLIFSLTVPNCFCTTRSELNSCDRDCRTHKVKNIYYPVFCKKKVCLPTRTKYISHLCLMKNNRLAEIDAHWGHSGFQDK